MLTILCFNEKNILPIEKSVNTRKGWIACFLSMAKIEDVIVISPHNSDITKNSLSVSLTITGDGC